MSWGNLIISSGWLRLFLGIPFFLFFGALFKWVMLFSQIKWQRDAVMVHSLIYLFSVIVYQQKLSWLKTNLSIWNGIGTFEKFYKEFDYLRNCWKNGF